MQNEHRHVMTLSVACMSTILLSIFLCFVLARMKKQVLCPLQKKSAIDIFVDNKQMKELISNVDLALFTGCRVIGAELRLFTNSLCNGLNIDIICIEKNASSENGSKRSLHASFSSVNVMTFLTKKFLILNALEVQWSKKEVLPNQAIL